MQIDPVTPGVIDTPFVQRLKNGEQRARRRRQTVFDAFRHRVIQRPAVHEAVGFDLPQLRDEDFARCPRNQAQQLGETQRAALEVIHDRGLPHAADAVHRNLDAAEIVLGDSARACAHRFSRLTGWSWRRNKAQICNVSAGTKKKPAFFRRAGFRQRNTGSGLARLYLPKRCKQEGKP